MISNERHFPSTRLTYDRPFEQVKPPIQEETLKTGQLLIERKIFFFTLKENARGRFLRITENAGGRRNSIVIPATRLGEFLNLLHEMIKTSDQRPPQ